jgi:hypothetical protein
VRNPAARTLHSHVSYALERPTRRRSLLEQRIGMLGAPVRGEGYPSTRRGLSSALPPWSTADCILASPSAWCVPGEEWRANINCAKRKDTAASPAGAVPEDLMPRRPPDARIRAGYARAGKTCMPGLKAILSVISSKHT